MTDRFGYRLGTRAATVSAALTGAPQTVAQLEATTKCKAIREHLLDMLRKGYIQKHNIGRNRVAFSLAPAYRSGR
jgi:hypothetical protein